MAENFTSKVLDFTKRVQAKKTQNNGFSTDANAAFEIIDITTKRQEIIADERRKVKRTILTEFVGACLVVPDQGLFKVALHDVSETGLAFDLELNNGHLQVGDEVAMRVYLNNSTYFPFTVKVNNVREIEGDGTVRHGVSFVKGTINDVALHHFVKFIESVSSCLETDHGDIMVTKVKV